MVSRKPKRVEVDYNEIAKNVLRAELRRRGLTYAELTALLNEASGETTVEKIISNKVQRGTFSAAFLMQCLDVIGAKAIQIAD